MSNISVFDIMGPVMIGPSSSHTAGAERLGKAARTIGGSEIKAADFYLHGSFAKTYKGHGTDRALVAGILGMETDDENIKESFQLAEAQGIKIQFHEVDLGEVHPNTVRIALTKTDGTQVTVTGSSIGGGNIMITNIDGDDVEFTGKFPVVIIRHRDKPGMLSKISLIIALYGINIATLKVGRQTKGQTATTVIESDNVIPDEAVEEIQRIDSVSSVRSLDAI